MLHPTHLPASEPALQALIKSIEHLLELACRPEPIDQPLLVAEFGQEVADWLYENRQFVLDPLKEFAKESQADKDQVLAAFRHDVLYPVGWDDGSFTFSLCVDNASVLAAKRARDWLVKWYEQLQSKQIHPALMGNMVPDLFRRSDWWKSYLQPNIDRRTCAVCEVALTNQTVTAEHYFYKKRYPALSVHPHNLLPICEPCNSRAKGEKDALNGYSILEIFLPYHRTISDQARLTFDVDADGNEQPCFQIVGGEPEVPKRLASFLFLFDLPRRWSITLDSIRAEAFRTLGYSIKSARAGGREVSDKTLATLVEETCTEMEQDWGKWHYYYQACQWLRWAKDNKLDLLYSECVT